MALMTRFLPEKNTVAVFPTVSSRLFTRSCGAPMEVATLDPQIADARFPVFLPDGRSFLFLAWSPLPGDRAIYAGALSGSAWKTSRAST